MNVGAGPRRCPSLDGHCLLGRILDNLLIFLLNGPGWFSRTSVFSLFFNPRLRIRLLILGERGREGEKTKYMDGLPSVCALTGIEPTTFLVYGTTLQPTESPGQGGVLPANTPHPVPTPSPLLLAKVWDGTSAWEAEGECVWVRGSESPVAQPVPSNIP